MLIFWLIAAFTWNGIQFDVCSRKGYRINHVFFLLFKINGSNGWRTKLEWCQNHLIQKKRDERALLAELNLIDWPWIKAKKKLHFTRITKNRSQLDRSSMSIMHSLTYRQIWLRSQLFDLLISLIPSSVPYNCVFVKENRYSSWNKWISRICLIKTTPTTEASIKKIFLWLVFAT